MGPEWWHWIVGGIVPGHPRFRRGDQRQGRAHRAAGRGMDRRATRQVSRHAQARTQHRHPLPREVRLESAKRDANSQVMLPEASAEAIRRITAAIGDQTGPMSDMLGEKYIAPADLQEAVRGLFGRSRV